MNEPARFDILQDNRDFNFYFTSAAELDGLEVEFGSDHGDYRIRLAMADAPAFTVATSREVMSRMIESPPAYRWKGLYLYRISMNLQNESNADTGLTPYIFALRPGR
jgi:hypothetical protein